MTEVQRYPKQIGESASTVPALAGLLMLVLANQGIVNVLVRHARNVPGNIEAHVQRIVEHFLTFGAEWADEARAGHDSANVTGMPQHMQFVWLCLTVLPIEAQHTPPSPQELEEWLVAMRAYGSELGVLGRRMDGSYEDLKSELKFGFGRLEVTAGSKAAFQQTLSSVWFQGVLTHHGIALSPLVASVERLSDRGVLPPAIVEGFLAA